MPIFFASQDRAYQVDETNSLTLLQNFDILEPSKGGGHKVVKIIRLKKVEKTRKRYEPETPFWKGLNENQRKAYIASMDELDKGAIKTRKDCQYS